MKPNIAEIIRKTRKQTNMTTDEMSFAAYPKKDVLELCGEVERQAEEIKELRKALQGLESTYWDER